MEKIHRNTPFVFDFEGDKYAAIVVDYRGASLKSSQLSIYKSIKERSGLLRLFFGRYKSIDYITSSNNSNCYVSISHDDWYSRSIIVHYLIIMMNSYKSIEEKKRNTKHCDDIGDILATEQSHERDKKIEGIIQ